MFGVRKLRNRTVIGHPQLDFAADLAAGRITEMPALSPIFKCTIPADDDFLVRFKDEVVRCLRNKDGSIRVFADQNFQIELIGTNKERYKRATRKLSAKKKVSRK